MYGDSFRYLKLYDTQNQNCRLRVRSLHKLDEWKSEQNLFITQGLYSKI